MDICYTDHFAKRAKDRLNWNSRLNERLTNVWENGKKINDPRNSQTAKDEKFIKQGHRLFVYIKNNDSEIVFLSVVIK